MTSAWEYYIGSRNIWVSLYLAMPDHIHGLFSFPSPEPMQKAVRDWKRYVAKQAAVTWQAGFFDHRLRSNESHAQKAEYIRQNPVRAGLVKETLDWPFIWSPNEQETGGRTAR